MPYEIRYSNEALERLKKLRAFDRTAILDQIAGGTSMTVQRVSDPKTPISEILKAAGSEGIVVESEDQGRYAVIPLDDDLIDFLMERSPKLRAECRQIRERMDAGQFQTHEDVRRQFPRE